jgi:hypothetical protein
MNSIAIFIIRDNSYDLLIENDGCFGQPMAMLTILASRFYPVEQHSPFTAEITDDVHQLSREHNVFFINNPADKLKCLGRLPAMVITAKQALDAGDRLGDYKSGVDYFREMAFSYTSEYAVQPLLIAEHLHEYMEDMEGDELIYTLRRIILDNIESKKWAAAIDAGQLPANTCRNRNKNMCLWDCTCY